MRATYERRTKRERDRDREREKERERERGARRVTTAPTRESRRTKARTTRVHDHATRGAATQPLAQAHRASCCTPETPGLSLSLSLSLSRSRRDLLLRLAFPPIDRSSQRLFISSPSAIYSSRLYTSFETLSFFLWIIV